MNDEFAECHRSGTGSDQDLGWAERFELPGQSSHTLRTLRRDSMAVSELRIETPSLELTEPLGYDEAFLVALHLADLVDHELWLDGRFVTAEPFRAGATYICDLRQDPRALVRQPVDVLFFYLPLATLNAFAEQHDVHAISELSYRPGVGRDDPAMAHLGSAVLAAAREPRAVSGLFLDQILNAVCARTLMQYGSGRFAARRQTGRLAPWQERRAKQMMDEIMDVSLSELAAECRLSVTHFVRAFRRSTGVSPHQWLLARRIGRAKSLLGSSNLTLAEIALTCGFSSQSHFSRAFAASVGVPPGRWRRRADST